MEYTASVFPFFIFILILIGIFYNILSKSGSGNFFFRKALHPDFVLLLEAKFPYYKTLSQDEKKEFGYRLNYFLHNKKFIGKQNLIVTDEMKVLVGATAVQITFGFYPLQLPSFDKIILYPKAYYSKHTKRYHKGEINTAGIIVYSWEDFLKGYQYNEDGYNVGLHEIAHAIKIEDFTPNNECAFLDEEVLMHWQNLTAVEMRKIRTKENTFLRPYAATNREEFFAVCVEQFFEQPEAFQKACPEVYGTLALLLNQDPLKRKA